LSANTRKENREINLFIGPEGGFSEAEIKENLKGHAFETKRIIMPPSTYPKSWHSKQTPKEKQIQ